MEQYTKAKMDALKEKNDKRIKEMKENADKIAKDEDKDMNYDQALEHLAQIQIDKIEDAVKAYTRAETAKSAGLDKVAKMFFDKADSLGFKEEMLELKEEEVSESIMTFDEWNVANEEGSEQ